MPPPPKLGDRVKKARRRPGPTKEINKQNSVHTTTTHYLPPHPQNINQHKAPKTYSWLKGTTCKMPPPQKIRGQNQKDEETVRDLPQREQSGRDGDEELKGCNEEE